MYSKRFVLTKNIIKGFTIFVVVFFIGWFTWINVLRKYTNSSVLAKIPLVHKWIENKNFQASVYEPEVEDKTNTVKSAKKTKKGSEEYTVPEKIDLKIGSFKKLKVNKSAGAEGKVSTPEVSVTETTDEGKVVTKTIKAELKTCKSGKLKGWVYITVPNHVFNTMDIKIARIKAPLFSAESPFALVPIVGNPKSSNPEYMFLISEENVELGRKYLRFVDKFTKSYGKVPKKELEDLLVYLLLSLDESSQDRKQGQMSTVLQSVFAGGLTSIPSVGRFMSARAPGEFNGKSAEDKEQGYRKIVHALIYGDDENIRIEETPELKACREFINTGITHFTFKLEATEDIPAEYKHGKFVSAKDNKVYKNFLKPFDEGQEKVCDNNTCYLALEYWGNPQIVLMNQLNICYNALGKFNGITKAPGEKDNRVVDSSCEGVYCDTNNVSKQDVLKRILTSIIFDISAQKPLNFAVVSRELAAGIQDPFGGLLKKGLDLIKVMLSPGENGLYRKADKVRTLHGALPIKVDCSCPSATDEVLISEWLKDVPGWAKPFLEPYIRAKSKVLAFTGHGLGWSCTFEPGSLLLSSTFDTMFAKSTEVSANASFAKSALDGKKAPGDVFKRYSFAELAQAMGRLHNCPVNDKNGDKVDIDVKNIYKSNYGNMPILLHQRVYFDTVPPLRGEGYIPADSLPSVFRKPQEAYIDFPVYSEAPGSMVINNMYSQIKKAPSGDGSDVPDTTFYKVLFCYISLYTNTGFGHMEFSCQNSNTAEAEYVSDLALCADLKPEDYIKVGKMLGLTKDTVTVKGKFDDLDGIFKK